MIRENLRVNNFAPKNFSKANTGDEVQLKNYQGRIKKIFLPHLAHTKCLVLGRGADPNQNNFRSAYKLICECGEELVIQAIYFDVIKRKTIRS